MNEYFCKETPLMLSVFNFLKKNEIQKWRMTSHNRVEETDLHAKPLTWKQYVCHKKKVLECEHCSCLRSKYALTHCIECQRAICAEKCTALYVQDVYCLECIY